MSETRTPKILFAHDRDVIGEAAARVLQAHGFEVKKVKCGRELTESLEGEEWDGLVLDVAFSEGLAYEWPERARKHGVKVVVLIASVYRKTAYKRRPTRLYGADDYVEIHHIGDHLPQRLRKALGRADLEMEEEAKWAYRALRKEGDARLDGASPHYIASLIVADLLLYNGKTIEESNSIEEAREALKDDLAGARGIFAEAVGSELARDYVGEAFSDIAAGALGREFEGEGGAV